MDERMKQILDAEFALQECETEIAQLTLRVIQQEQEIRVLQNLLFQIQANEPFQGVLQ